MCHSVTFHTISYYIILYHIISYHIISYHSKSMHSITHVSWITIPIRFNLTLNLGHLIRQGIPPTTFPFLNCLYRTHELPYHRLPLPCGWSREQPHDVAELVPLCGGQHQQQVSTVSLSDCPIDSWLCQLFCKYMHELAEDIERHWLRHTLTSLLKH